MIHENFYLYDELSPVALRSLVQDLLMRNPNISLGDDKDVASLMSFTVFKMTLATGEDFMPDFDHWVDNCDLDFVTGLEENYPDILINYGLAPERYYLDAANLPLASLSVDGWRMFSRAELVYGLNLEHNSLGVGKVERTEKIGNETFVVLNFGDPNHQYLNIKHNPFRKV